MIEFDQSISLRNPLPLVGRVRVGVAQACHIRKNFNFSPPVGATPTPTLPTRGREKKKLNQKTVGIHSPPLLQRIFLVRHGQTAWSLSGQHTGRTDIPLTARGEAEARTLHERLRSNVFNRVFTSPLQRARQTADLAELAMPIEIEPDLVEWDHGEYEGLRSVEIRAIKPDWNLYQHGCPGGESTAQVSMRADRMIARLRALEGDIAIFSHGHFGCVLAVRWIGLKIEHASHFLLGTASVSILGYGHHRATEPAIMLWNARPDATSEP